MLELGSGTGACGLYAASLGSARVLLTDGREGLLPLQQHNIDCNAPLLQRSGAQIDTMTLLWGVDKPPEGPWDLILGSDVTYDTDDEAMSALATTLAALLQPEPPPRVIIAHDHRRRDTRHMDKGSSWELFDENLDRFAVAAAHHKLTLHQLTWERPSLMERMSGAHEISVIEVVRAG